MSKSRILPFLCKYHIFIVHFLYFYCLCRLIVKQLTTNFISVKLHFSYRPIISATIQNVPGLWTIPSGHACFVFVKNHIRAFYKAYLPSHGYPSEPLPLPISLSGYPQRKQIHRRYCRTSPLQHPMQFFQPAFS